MTHLNTKKQGIISPKRLKKSALGRFYSFLILQSSIGNFSHRSVEIHCTFLVHFWARGKSAYLCSLHQTAALFHLLWIFWYSGWTFFCIFLPTDSPRKSKNFSLLSPSSCSHEEGTRWWGFSLILVFNNIISLCVALRSTHRILRCSQGVLCSQGYSAQWPCWFLLLNLPSVFFFICCCAYLYQLLVLRPIPFSRALSFSVWISFNSFYIFSNKDASKKNTRTGRHTATSSQPCSHQPESWMDPEPTLHFITLLPSQLQRWIIYKLPLSSKTKQTHT